MTLLKEVFSEVKDFVREPISVIETGCSFQWDEKNLDYLSTLNIMEHLVINSDGGFLASIDIDINHLRICEDNLFKRGYIDSIYPKWFTWRCDSVEYFKAFQYRSKSSINVFWLDSEENEKHGLEEYKYALEFLKRPGVICIDDYGSEGSVKWRSNSEELKVDASYYKEYDTPTGLIVGYYS